MPELLQAALNVYTTNHIHSQVICKAFADGHNGKIVPPTVLLDGPGMVYGILRGCAEIIKVSGWTKRRLFYVDHGYLERGYYEGYFRVCGSGLQSSGDGDYKPDRFENTGTKIRPWNRTGRHVIVCPISKYLGDFLGIDQKKWTEAVVRELAKFTDRPIIIKEKDGSPLPLKDAWCLVTYTSNAAVDAVVSGIPDRVAPLARS